MGVDAGRVLWPADPCLGQRLVRLEECVRGLGFGIWSLVFGFWGFGVGLWGLECRVWGLGFGVWRLGVWV